MAEPLRILLVDDDEVDRLAVKRLLRGAGIAADVSERVDRASALATARSERFDCVLLDYRLPGVDGVTLLRELRSSGVGSPVVALTGQGDEEVAVELMKAGAADYLNKNGLTAERLERSLRYAMAIHRAEEERRLLLEREHQARLEAQAANHAKDEFLATLSHELRTPLNAILGWAQLLAGGQLSPETAARAVEIIERNTRLQAQLIDDLLDISRIITGKLRLEQKVVAVRAIVDAALESVLPAATAKRVALVREEGGDDHAIFCDPSRMQQVLWNLLSNAIKFTPPGGRVTLSQRREDGLIALAVGDTGVGIEAEFLPHVFDRFRQQDPASTRKHGGLGLGLSIVRHLVDLHGASIEALSDGPGRGATFIVRVPVSPVTAGDDTDAVLVAAPAAQEAQPSLAGIRILVVDNDADARGLITTILEGRGAEVRAVESAALALDAIVEWRPDVLLSDIAMPGEDGYTLIRRIRSRESAASPPLPAAALTAYATIGDRAQALRAGYQAHLAKPIEPAKLTATVAALAGRLTLDATRTHEPLTKT
jgi:signal transduction histidine kinase